MYKDYYPWWWRCGRPADLWIKNIERIQELITKFNLKPLPEEYSKIMELPIIEERRPTIRRPPIPGGIKIAHVHFKDDVYLLNEEQWREFTGSVIKDFQAKLSKVKIVTIAQTIELSEALDNIG
jgi:hypothetical protein